jgi:NAD kinase
LVFDGSKELCVWFRDETQNLRLILDGQIEQPLLASDKILIKRSDFTVPTISIGNRTFTRVLRHKFNLGTESSIE